jgi:hypothetical protein
MLDRSLQQIVDRWKQAFGQYGALSQNAGPDIVRWEWTGGERYSPLPFYFRRFPGRARALKEPPATPGYYLRYGFDALDRPRLHRFYGYLDLHGQERLRRDQARGFERDDLSETLYSYSDALVEVIEYSVPPRIPLKAQQTFLQDGRVVRHLSFRVNGYTPLYSRKGRDPDAFYEWLGPNGRFRTVEEYVYDGARLAQILVYQEAPGAGAFTTEERFRYDQAGKLLGIERFYQTGASRIVYRRRPRGQTFSSIRQTATQTMIEAIVERLRAEQVRERLYCIELAYESAIHHFPPQIILGPERYRQDLLTSSDPDAPFYVFAPLFQGQWLEIDDPATLEICGLLEQEIQAGQKWETARRILREVAAALTRHDWRGILDVTPDFVVYAIDHELEADYLEEALLASVSKQQVAEWKAQGWL